MATLAEIRSLVEREASYEEFPDGVTWADVEAALATDEDEDSDARRNDQLQS